MELVKYLCWYAIKLYFILILISTSNLIKHGFDHMFSLIWSMSHELTRNAPRNA